MSVYNKIDSNSQYYCGYKFPIYPNDEEKELFEQGFNSYIYVYNWAIEQEEKQYQLYINGYTDKSFLTFLELDRKFRKHRNSTEWLQKSILIGAAREVLLIVVNDYKNFFDGIRPHPSFVSKKRSSVKKYHPRSDRSYIKNGRLRVEGLSKKGNETIKIDKCVLNYDFCNCKLIGTTISRDNLGNYYVSFSVVRNKPLSYFEDNNIPKMDRAIGIDLNFRKDARVVCSDGTRFMAPDISKEEKKIKRLSRKCGKDRRRLLMQKRTNSADYCEPSKNSEKRKHLLRKQYRKIANKNYTFACTVAKRIAEKNPLAIVMEDLQIANGSIAHDSWTAKYIQFNPLRIIRDKIENACNIYGINFILAPKEYKSSQICSNCGHIKNIWRNKNFNCPVCGLHIDRDDNAALNLEHLAYNYDFTHMSNINLATI